MEDVYRLAELARPPAVWKLSGRVGPIAEIVGVESHALETGLDSVVIAHFVAQ